MKLNFDTIKIRHVLIKVFSYIRLGITKPHVVFLVIGGLFGIIYIFLVPPFYQPDEIAHFNRIYQISHGNLGEQKIPGPGYFGDYIPIKIINFENYYYESLIHGNNNQVTLSTIVHEFSGNSATINTNTSRRPLEFSNTEQYSPMLYIPQVFGMLISKIINLTIPDTFYLVRMFGFLAWLIICTFAIKRMKIVGWAIAILLLTPLSISVATSISADPMTIAYSSLFIALVFEAVTTKHLNKNRILLFMVTAILLASTKIPYVLILLTTLLIPSSSFIKGTKQKVQFLTALACIVIAFTGSWLLITRVNHVSYRTISGGANIDENINESFLLDHPLTFGHKLYDTYLRVTPYSSSDPEWGFVGVLTATGMSIPAWAVGLYFATLGGVFVKLREGAVKREYLSIAKRGYIFGITLVLFMAVNAAVFVSWSREKVQIIEGIQSRYFIPISLLAVFFMIPIYRSNVKLSNTFFYFYVLAIAIIQLSAILAIYYQFYTNPMPVFN